MGLLADESARQSVRQYRRMQGETYAAQPQAQSAIIVSQDAVRVGGTLYRMVNSGGLVLIPGHTIDVVPVGRPAAQAFAPLDSPKQREAGRRADPLGAHDLLSGAHSDTVPNGAYVIGDTIVWNGAAWTATAGSTVLGGGLRAMAIGIANSGPMGTTTAMPFGPMNTLGADLALTRIGLRADDDCEVTVEGNTIAVTGDADNVAAATGTVAADATVAWTLTGAGSALTRFTWSLAGSLVP